MTAPALPVAPRHEFYIGVMSGTSTDGVDGVLATFNGLGHPSVVAKADLPMPADLRAEILALNYPGHNELERSARVANTLADIYAQIVQALLSAAQVPACHVRAVGVHGQTVRHAPEHGYTIQLNAPARLAQACGIDVIADFRSRDIAAGGQGAPLVPAFHKALFGTERHRVILNLGGIANITILAPDRTVTGFDTGPANTVLDHWIEQHLNKPYDHDGAWAAQGRHHEELLDYLITSETWFNQAPPKSTGRHVFHMDWLNTRLQAFTHRTTARTADTDTQAPIHQTAALTPADIQATLRELTAETVARAIGEHAPEAEEILVCGGGALNTGLMNSLQQRTGLDVKPTSAQGIDPLAVEALAFAWLARAHVHRIAAGHPDITGARHRTVLGCCYPHA